MSIEAGIRLPCALDCGWRVGLTDTKTTTGASSYWDTRPLEPEFAASKVNLALARRRNRVYALLRG